jgi:hypothetical protein
MLLLQWSSLTRSAQLTKLAFPHFSNVEGTHSIDGLWVPTKGVRTALLNDDKTRRRPRLFVSAKECYGISIAYEATEILGADDQSVFLSLCAQAAGKHRILIDGNAESNPILARYRAGLKIPSTSSQANAPVISFTTSLYGIARDAGLAGPEKRGPEIRESLRRLNAVTVTEFVDVPVLDVAGRAVLDQVTGRPVTTSLMCPSQLISYEYDLQTMKTIITINPRQTATLLGEQKIQVSLTERRRLTGEVSKLLHFWLCAYVRLNASLGVNGNGALIDTLVKHVWNESVTPEGALKKKLQKLEVLELKKAVRAHELKMNRRRRLIIKALNEIKEKTEWKITIGERLVYVVRPRRLALDEHIKVVRRPSPKTDILNKADGAFDQT